MKKRSSKTQESSRAEKQKVLETVAEASGLAAELLQGVGVTDVPNISETQAKDLYKLEDELCDVCEEAEA